MTRSGPYRNARADAEPEPIEVMDLRRRIDALENAEAAFNFPGGRRGIDFEIECIRERIDALLAEIASR